ncbi:unnamed protein product [Arabidopsis thaliana]|uniref:(thale cress) hypothetical protein n=1 Tax=Arabidopsis thaliana TaxID=3702 RepID=A0A7G2FLH8_ARATH|nr:unnamed protein product [Arabidopsis thaliana]
MIICVQVLSLVLAQDRDEFVYHDFSQADLHLDGMASIDDGRLHLTNNTTKSTGHAFWKIPMNFTTSPSSSLSFSTEFVFAIFPLLGDGQGMAFVVAPFMDIRYSGDAASYLGLFNRKNDNKTENHILAVELDTNPSPEAIEDSDNHVGIDINSIISEDSANASYFSGTEGKNISFRLASEKSILVWIDYNGTEKLLNVTVAPVTTPKPVSPYLSSSIKPRKPLLSRSINISEIFNGTMFVGFSGSTGTVKSDQYILGWSFKKGGQAESLDISKILDPPNRPPPPSSPQPPTPPTSSEEGINEETMSCLEMKKVPKLGAKKHNCRGKERKKGAQKYEIHKLRWERRSSLFLMAGVLGSVGFWMIIGIHVTFLVFAQDGDQFVYYDFRKANLELDGMANTDGGPLHLTNNTNTSSAHAFHKFPMKFTASSPSSFSFSTEFVFAIFPLQGDGQGMAFVVSPTTDLRYSRTETSYLGLFNKTNDNSTANHILAVELDTNFSPEPLDISNNHVGIDINSIVSDESANASYFDNIGGKNTSLRLASGKNILIWIDYDGIEKILNVTLAPVPTPKPVSPYFSSSIKPNVPLLSRSINLSEIFKETMFVGFSGSTGTVKSDQYILGWSFKKGNRPSMRQILQYLEGNVSVPAISFDAVALGIPNISHETVTQMTTTSSSANFSFEDVTVLFGGR